MGESNRGTDVVEDDQRLMEVLTYNNAKTFTQTGPIYSVDRPKEQEKHSSMAENMQLEEGNLYTIQVE